MPGARAIRSCEQELAVNIDRAVLTLAGGMILLSLVLAWLVSPYWLLLTAFVGANMLQAAFTGFCPAAIIFRKLGLRSGPAFDWPTVAG
jgi:hypothetical protein